jgi:putative transposase
MDERVNHQPHIQFFTATNLWWKKLLKPDKYKQIVIDSLAFLVKDNRIKVDGFVVMTNYIHLLWERNPLSVDLFTRKVIEQKLNNIHSNPLHEKWRLAQTPEDYAFSS